MCRMGVVVCCLMSPRIAAFYASSSLSGAFSGLLAAAIDQMDGKGGRPGWAWIFILVWLRLSLREMSFMCLDRRVPFPLFLA